MIEQFNKTTKIISEFFKQLYDGFSEKILPSIKESLTSIEQAISNLFDELFNISFDLFEKLVDLLEQHKADIQKVSRTVAASLQKWAALLNEQFEVAVREINAVWKLVLDQVNQLSSFDEVKQRVQEVTLPIFA